MDVSFTLAGWPTTSVGQPLQIGVIRIFTLGADATDNPETDPAIAGGRQDLTVIPTVLKLESPCLPRRARPRPSRTSLGSTLLHQGKSQS